MDSTDIKAYGEAFKKIWPGVVVKIDEDKLDLITMGNAMLEMWKAAKEHYEKEYNIPKAEGTL